LLDHYRERYPRQWDELARLLDRAGLPAPGSDILPVEQGYRLIRVLGKGTFGEVWEARAPGDFPAAVKIIQRTLDSEEVQRERRALDVIRRLQHPHLLGVLAAWHLQDRLIIVMELADGNLRERLHECRRAGHNGIPREELGQYLTEAAAALDYLHGKGACHRDVKPDNILLRGGCVKVADFGLLRDQNQAMTLHRPVGTPPYMAPEVWECKPVPASDQYALACAYVELRCGRRPFPQRTTDELNKAHAHELPDVSLLSQAEQQVVLRALAKQPEQRFASCAEFVRELTAAEIGEDEPLGAAPRSSSQQANLLKEKTKTFAPVRLARRQPALIGLLLGLCCGVVAGLAAWSLWVPSSVDVPDGYAPAPQAIVDRQGAPYYSRIVGRKGREEVSFLLIRPSDEQSTPFYLMENKVSNGLFAVFAEEQPQAAGSSWQLGGQAGGRDLGNKNERLPVFRVTRPQAEAFARWLGGTLPSAAQLDQAGAHQREPSAPPAIGRWEEGPREVANARSAGLWDMDSNGREWTRDELRSEEGETLAILRGRSYAARPTSRADRHNRDLEPTQFPSHASPFTTFRVVIELAAR
jgi:hypothetical protein